MITKDELERIKQGDGLTVESNGIKHYGASEVLINGHSLTELHEAGERIKRHEPKQDTLQDVIDDLYKTLLSMDAELNITVPVDIIDRLEAIQERMGGE